MGTDICTTCVGAGYCRDYDSTQSKWVKCPECNGIGEVRK